MTNTELPDKPTEATDWKSIAMELARRLNYAMSYGKFSGFLLDMNSGESQWPLDYFADGIEMIPGMKVDREILHMTPAQRQKFKKTGAKS